LIKIFTKHSLGYHIILMFWCLFIEESAPEQGIRRGGRKRGQNIIVEDNEEIEEAPPQKKAAGKFYSPPFFVQIFNRKNIFQYQKEGEVVPDQNLLKLASIFLL